MIDTMQHRVAMPNEGGRAPFLGIEEEFRSWCNMQSLEPHPELFGYFITAFRGYLYGRYSSTLMNVGHASFGPDGGSGFVLGVQGEDREQIEDGTREMRSIAHVGALSKAGYFSVLHHRIAEPYNAAVIGEVPEDGAPPSVLVQGEYLHEVQKRIEHRQYLRRNVSRVVPLDERRYWDLLGRRNDAHLPNWHVPALDPTPQST